MAKSVLLSDDERRALLELVLEAGGDRAACEKVARRVPTSRHSLARWISGLGGPLSIDRAKVARMVGARKGDA